MALFEIKPFIPALLKYGLPTWFNQEESLQQQLENWIQVHPQGDVGDLVDALLYNASESTDLPPERMWDQIIRRKPNLPSGEVLEPVVFQYESGKLVLEFSDTSNIRGNAVLVIKNEAGFSVTPVHDLTPFEDCNVHILLFVDENEEGRVITLPKANRRLITEAKYKDKGLNAVDLDLLLNEEPTHTVHQLKQVGDAYIFLANVEDKGVWITLPEFMILWVPEGYW